MNRQYIVQEDDKKKRKEFYEYVVESFNLTKSYPHFKKEFIKSNFPFVVDFDENNFWICDSITCCACAAQNHRIISIDEFK